MTRRRTGDPWMPAPQFGGTLQGLTVNLLVRDISASLPFHLQVLGATSVYEDPDIAVLHFNNAGWMLHAWHTYDSHPLHPVLTSNAPRGVGAELRLHGRDPDDAELKARALGHEVIQATANKAHGLRECFLRDDDGYVWVPDVPVP